MKLLISEVLTMIYENDERGEKHRDEEEEKAKRRMERRRKRW